mmetsp:Transcript_62295/g.136078  ORF Transcript_62295/g.136078 Transcript_62295/m.136078 type:complete len:151 (+) Transcript_62295:409-861(+)|eukprot:CAMPEP_0206474558 /NCGR_PEP_ID=MMETSP0324_2-20121206/33554_1 /ASSEMBLY_ACC=CAM_ASM_000836 /TAXON_ID=2866 /ORGANISM="Crypthecodinium cohnii, Strain Seligo" /LENGTH=150 /DNA_ID=CAMNT_0053949745 /DNA_START=306 /DNA_END=758 /DNA_ORIENTATION=-
MLLQTLTRAAGRAELRLLVQRPIVRGVRSISSSENRASDRRPDKQVSGFANRLKANNTTTEEKPVPCPPDVEFTDKATSSNESPGTNSHTCNSNNNSNTNTNNSNTNTNNSNSESSCRLTREDKKNIAKLALGVGLCVLAAAIGSDSFKM